MPAESLQRLTGCGKDGLGGQEFAILRPDLCKDIAGALFNDTVWIVAPPGSGKTSFLQVSHRQRQLQAQAACKHQHYSCLMLHRKHFKVVVLVSAVTDRVSQPELSTHYHLPR